MEAGLVFAKDKSAVRSDSLRTVMGEPLVLRFGQPVQRRNRAQSANDLFRRSRSGRRSGTRPCNLRPSGKIVDGLGGDGELLSTEYL